MHRSAPIAWSIPLSGMTNTSGYCKGKHVIGVTGGIGSGKSVVCRICRLLGLSVYDCDTRARTLMTESRKLRLFLTNLLGAEVYDADGCLNRCYMATRIFSDDNLRVAVNHEVHAAVREDFARWCEESKCETLVIEAAVMTSSGLADVVDEIWHVTAPEETRIERACSRDDSDVESVTVRIEAQKAEYLSLPPQKTHVIVNDGVEPLLPRIQKLLRFLK